MRLRYSDATTLPLSVLRRSSAPSEAQHSPRPPRSRGRHAGEPSLGPACTMIVHADCSRGLFTRPRAWPQPWGFQPLSATKPHSDRVANPCIYLVWRAALCARSPRLAQPAMDERAHINPLVSPIRHDVARAPLRATPATRLSIEFLTGRSTHARMHTCGATCSLCHRRGCRKPNIGYS